MSLAICVYCGSGDGKDPAYAAAAEKLGAMIAGHGHRLVYGGGNYGLMGRVARATKAAGGHVTGIIPEFLITKEKLKADNDEVVLVQNMHERKMQMFERSDAFVTLPGGIGTLEELVEQMTWAQLGRHKKPIVIADINGFWRPFRSLIAHMREEGFIRAGLEVSTLTAERIEDVIPIIEDAIARHGRQPGPADWSARLM
jgi:uncharacterized protein (TIGR00730 family)